MKFLVTVLFQTYYHRGHSISPVEHPLDSIVRCKVLETSSSNIEQTTLESLVNQTVLELKKEAAKYFFDKYIADFEQRMEKENFSNREYYRREHKREYEDCLSTMSVSITMFNE